MPRKSVKKELVESLIEDAANTIMLIDEMEDSEDEDEIMEIFDNLNEDILTVLSCRRGEDISNVPKSIECRENMLVNMCDERFVQMLRVNRSQFAHLVALIRDDMEFNKSHSIKQFSVELQLAVMLYRLGSHGENGTVNKIATLFGIGDGGTLTNITKRMFRVIMKLMPKYIFWPNREERAQIVAATYLELPLCIGYVDGTEIKLAEAPVIQQECFFSRSYIYSIKAQVVCDYKLRIRHVVVGSPGSCHDAKIFKNCSIYRNKKDFFSAHEWIAGDSVYQLSDTVVTPYRSNSKQMTDAKRKMFNWTHSKFRVRIEHCFGLLKDKFQSLKELRIRIDNMESHKHCCEWILVCCILHNILLTGREVEDIPEYTVPQSAEEDDTYTDHKQYELKRQGIFNLMYENSN